MPKINLFHPPFFLSLFFFLLSLGGYIILVDHFPRLWEKPDLLMYYVAGQDVLAGRNVYLTGQTYFNFLYTPFSALQFAPYALFSREVLKWTMTIGSLVSLLLSTWLSLRFLAYPNTKATIATTVFLSAFLLWLEPVQQTFEYGQINLILMAIILGGYYVAKQKPSGLLIGLATAIKLTPAIFIIYLFLTKRSHKAMLAIITIIITILVGYIVLPESSQLYWQGLFLDTSRIGDVRLIGNQSLQGMFTRVWGIHPMEKLLLNIVSMAIAIWGLVIAKQYYERKEELFSILIVAVTGLLISPFSWSHHWVWFVPLFIYFFVQTYTKQYYYGWLGLLVMFILFGWLTPLIPNLSSMTHIMQFTIPKLHQAPFLQENIYILSALLLLVVSSIALFNKRGKKHL